MQEINNIKENTYLVILMKKTWTAKLPFTITLLLALLIGTCALSTVSARSPVKSPIKGDKISVDVYSDEYETVLNARGSAQVVAGQIVAIKYSEGRILSASTGDLGCRNVAFGWSCTWSNPYWKVDTAPGNSHAYVKIWQKVSSPFWEFWEEDGDLWNKVYYYGGYVVKVYGNYVGNMGPYSVEKVWDLLQTISQIVSIVISLK